MLLIWVDKWSLQVLSLIKLVLHLKVSVAFSVNCRIPSFSCDFQSLSVNIFLYQNMAGHLSIMLD